jgi:hypothetical protein
MALAPLARVARRRAFTTRGRVPNCCCVASLPRLTAPHLHRGVYCDWLQRMCHPSLYVNISRNETLDTIMSRGCNFIVDHIRGRQIALCDSARSGASVLLPRMQSRRVDWAPCGMRPPSLLYSTSLRLAGYTPGKVIEFYQFTCLTYRSH